MSKVFLCGDPHGEFDHILSAIDQWHPDAVLILGDLTPSHSLDEIFKGVKGTKIYWIPGNHDTDSDLIYDRLWRSSFAKHNLHGRVQDVCGVKVAGLGGVFRGQIWMPPAMPLYLLQVFSSERSVRAECGAEVFPADTVRRFSKAFMKNSRNARPTS